MSTFSKIINALRFIGIKKSLQTIQYALYRDRLENSIRNVNAGSRQPLSTPGNLLRTHKAGTQVNFQFDKHELEIKVLAQNLFRFTWLPGKLPADYALAETSWPPPEFYLTHSNQDYSLDTGLFRIEISKSALFRKIYLRSLSSK